MKNILVKHAIVTELNIIQININILGKKQCTNKSTQMPSAKAENSMWKVGNKSGKKALMIPRTC